MNSKKIVFELKSSGIHGIGVFSTAKIIKGTPLPLFEKGDCRFIYTKDLKKTGIPLSHIRKYSVAFSDGYSLPKNFNRMSVGWYLNHADEPNAYCDKLYNYFALRNIEKNEEITIDYNKL